MQILDEEPAGDPEEELDDEGQGADDLSEMKVELVEGDHGVFDPVGAPRVSGLKFFERQNFRLGFRQVGKIKELHKVLKN